MKFTYALAAFAILLTAQLSRANVLFKTGFEATEAPAYAVGPLTGQNGWANLFGSLNPVVQTTSVFSGTQAVRLDATGLAGQNVFGYNVTQPPNEKVIVIDVHFMQSATGTSSIWDPIALIANTGFLAQIGVGDGVVVFPGSAGSLPAARGAWHDYRIVVDFGVGTMSAFVDGILLGTQSTGAATSITQVVLGINGNPASDSGFFDQLNVTSQAPVISKSFVPSTVALNGSSTLTITVTNETGATLTNVGFTDTLPAGIALGAGAGFGGCGSPVAGASGSLISMTGATIAAGGTCTFQVFVTGVSVGVWTNSTSDVTSTQGTGNSASAILVVAAPPTLTKTFADPVIYYLVDTSNTTTLSFTVTNPAVNTMPATNISFTDTLPAGLSIASPGVLVNNCGGTATAVTGSSSVSLSGVTLAGAASCTLSVQVVTMGIGPMVNTTSNITADGLTGTTATGSTFSSDMYLLWFFSN